MNTRLVLFDFDGTITSKDTLLAFIVFSHGKVRTLLGALVLSPYLIGWKLRLIKNQAAKEKVLRYFFRGESRASFDNRCMAFSAHKISRIVRPEAMRLIEDYKRLGARVVVVSASPENWVQPWCNNWKIDCVATRLEYDQDVLTGKITGINCYGEEKVERIKQLVRLDDYEVITAYGDSRGDHEMLALAHERHYRSLNNG